MVPPGHQIELKWDGFRAFFLRPLDGPVLIRSRHGTDLTADFPEIAAAALPDAVGDLALDGVMRSVNLSQGKVSRRSSGSVADRSAD